MKKLIVLTLFLVTLSAQFAFGQDVPAREFFNQGNEESKKGNLDAAIAAYSNAIRLDSEYSYAYNARGLVYLKKRQYDLAISDFTTAIYLNPASAGNYINRSSTYALLKDFEKAFADLDTAINKDPKFAEAYSARGNLYRQLKKFSESIENFDKAIAIKPYSYFYSGRCMTYYDYEKFQEAVADCSEAINLNSKDTRAYYYRGLSRIKLEQNALAILDLRRVLDIDPNFAFAKRELDKLLQKN